MSILRSITYIKFNNHEVKLLSGSTKIAVEQKKATGRSFSENESNALVNVHNWIFQGDLISLALTYIWVRLSLYIAHLLLNYLQTGLLKLYLYFWLHAGEY